MRAPIVDGRYDAPAGRFPTVMAVTWARGDCDPRHFDPIRR